ncbi:MAG: ADP-ribosylglycohydrolase family protein [Nitrospira sp.]|nr:ADP-ribosylglycohydrolase family protein [Nitrospira sp.]
MNVARANRVVGSVMALAIGDAFGAPYEGGILERTLWAFIGVNGGKRRWTDDTQMSVDVIESLVHCGCVDQDDLASRFAGSYRWSRGYGPGTRRILKRIRQGEHWETAAQAVFRNGSFGNGGAMRAPAVGLFFACDHKGSIALAANDVAAVTHAHPLAREGAVLVALATACALNDESVTGIIQTLIAWAKSPEYAARLRKADSWLAGGDDVSPSDVAAELGNGTAAVESCVTAVYIALAFINRPFDELLAFSFQLRGDVDTITAMASAMWGAARGLNELPQARLELIEQRDYLMALARSLAETPDTRLNDSLQRPRCRVQA